MRIYGPGGVGAGATTGNARRASPGSFSLPDTAASVETRPSAAPKAVGGIDALLALQGVDDPRERRKRAVSRGRSALDVLDELKIGLLSGSLDGTMVQRLRRAASELKDGSGDPALDQILAEIELRVEVELAKAGGA